LPVKNVMETSEFYDALGFRTDFQYGGAETGVKIFAGEQKTVVWFYAEKVFETFAQTNAVDAKQGVETLLSIYVESREDVNNITGKVFDAGGTVFSEPQWAFEWLYGCGFADLDGHRWSILYKDESKMPQI
jgi:uncharacterized protein